MKSDGLSILVQKTSHRDAVALSALLTQIDRQGANCLKNPLLLKPPQLSFRVGITGPPGAGKSTLIGAAIEELRRRNLTVGVLAVDPSSPFSEGAILGDRIRYNHFHADPGVFVRSIGTRGSLGGLCSSSYLMLKAYDLFGFDIVLVETVGVGQTELEIINVADYISVVLVPESGDSIQAMKAGLLEIADLFVVNKSDRPGAESFIKELENTLALGGLDDVSSILRTVATEKKGCVELVETWLGSKQKKEFEKNRYSAARLKAEARALVRRQIEEKLDHKIKKINSLDQLRKLVCQY